MLPFSICGWAPCFVPAAFEPRSANECLCEDGRRGVDVMGCAGLLSSGL